MILDSGNRQEFPSGAVRDIQTGKGRCDLLPLGVIGGYADIPFLSRIGRFIYEGESDHLWEAFAGFAVAAFGDLETALLETSIQYEEGAAKYEERNWEKGIPVNRFIDSAVRHYLKHNRGDRDERHDRAVCWNLLGALWTICYKPECINLPPDAREIEGDGE